MDNYSVDTSVRLLLQYAASIIAFLRFNGKNKNGIDIYSDNNIVLL